MPAELLVLGGGRMGEALAAGLLGAGWDAEGLVVVEAREARRRELASARPRLTVAAEPVPALGAVLAVKPADAEAACRQLAPLAPPRLLSIAAGVPLSSLEGWLPEATAVLRAMPNTPALIRAGASALSGGRGSGEAELAWAEGLLGAVGTVVRVAEAQLDAVTGLSGSGPAYVFLVAEALIEAGVAVGLAGEQSRALVVQTLLGSARLLAESGEPPAALRSAVTSPGGTTAAGLRALEARAVRSALIEAVVAAAERSAELGRREATG